MMNGFYNTYLSPEAQPAALSVSTLKSCSMSYSLGRFSELPSGQLYEDGMSHFTDDQAKLRLTKPKSFI